MRLSTNTKIAHGSWSQQRRRQGCTGMGTLFLVLIPAYAVPRALTDAAASLNGKGSTQ